MTLTYDLAETRDYYQIVTVDDRHRGLHPLEESPIFAKLDDAIYFISEKVKETGNNELFAIKLNGQLLLNWLKAGAKPWTMPRDTHPTPDVVCRIRSIYE